MAERVFWLAVHPGQNISVSLQWEWQCDEIDDMGTSLTSMGVALAEDGAGYPIIAYQDASDDLAPAALKVHARTLHWTRTRFPIVGRCELGRAGNHCVP